MPHHRPSFGPSLPALLGAALLGLCLSAVAAPKTGKAPAHVVAVPTAEARGVQRFIIRYRTGIKMGGQGAAAPDAERAQAAAQVARSAGLAGESRMHYLKSVSPSLHVATLDQPVTPAEAQALVQRLQVDPAVIDAMVDQRAKPHAVPNDPYYTGGQQWHLQPSSVIPGGLNVNSAWDRSTGAGVVIAVLDGGYVPHADLVGNLLLPSFDFVSSDFDPANPPSPAPYGGDAFWTSNDGDGRDAYAEDPGDWVTAPDVTAGFCDLAEDSTWHGSHVAGLAAAVGNNNRSGLGVAFGAKILPVRVLGRCGGYVSDILAGARWAAGLTVIGVPSNIHPARILNLSLGVPPDPAAPGCNSVIQDVVNEIKARNVSIVASSGNDSLTQISVPANCQGVFAVTAHTREGDSASYANVGVGVRVSAAGGGLNTSPLPELPGSPRAIVSTGNAGTTVPTSDADLLLEGTSMAAPQVAGVLALLAAARPDLPMATLESFVTSSARPFPAGGYCATNPDALAAGFCGSGLLDADAAMAAALGYSASSGGGGCTSEPGGQADLGLLLLALGGLGGVIWRRRPSR
jgi:serine protease